MIPSLSNSRLRDCFAGQFFRARFFQKNMQTIGLEYAKICNSDQVAEELAGSDGQDSGKSGPNRDRRKSLWSPRYGSQRAVYQARAIVI